MTGNALPRVKRAAHAHEMPYGTKIDAGGARFNFWAPLCDRVDLSIRGRSAPVPMARLGGGWFEAHVADAGPGAQYRFILPGGATCADPASRYQPDGPHGFSEVVDPRAYPLADARISINVVGATPATAESLGTKPFSTNFILARSLRRAPFAPPSTNSTISPRSASPPSR